MAQVRSNLIIRGVSGSLGDQLVIRQDKAGRTILSVMPSIDPNRTFSEAQLDRQAKFREAVQYGKSAKDQPIYAEKAKGTPQTAYNLAVADWFHAPEILELDVSACLHLAASSGSRHRWNGAAGETLRIKAVDDVQVTQVNVVITDAGGAVLEQGAATRAEGMWWSYTTTASAPNTPKIVVTARDLPGNIAEFHWGE